MDGGEHKMVSEEDIRGLEFDWLAVDAAGFVALFSTAGGGYAPEKFREDTTMYDAAIGAILALSANTAAVCKRELPNGLQNTWKLVAERGLFAFDSDPNGGPYERIAAPATPIEVSLLPTEVAVVATRIVYSNIFFESYTELTDAELRKHG
jgi:hypothetical protein